MALTESQVVIRVKTKMVIETFLVVSAAAFCFAVMPWRPWPDSFMRNVQLAA